MHFFNCTSSTLKPASSRANSVVAENVSFDYHDDGLLSDNIRVTTSIPNLMY